MESALSFLKEVLLTPNGLAGLSGLLQVLGYTLYISKSLKKELEPNPTSWLMFAYGTALLTLLEFDRGASWQLLVLPATCALLSIFVAFISCRRGKISWPDEAIDRLAFVADILLTIGYVWAWWLQAHAGISEYSREMAVLVFLLFSNATSFTAFVPLLRDAYNHPHRERSTAWVTWMVAYTTLLILTLWTSNDFASLCHAQSLHE